VLAQDGQIANVREQIADGAIRGEREAQRGQSEKQRQSGDHGGRMIEDVPELFIRDERDQQHPGDRQHQRAEDRDPKQVPRIFERCFVGDFDRLERVDEAPATFSQH
jgi:hypothetical protein